MKILFMIVVLFGTLALQAQEQPKPSLKDLLYSGKLKKDSSGVIRKSDDLSKHIDTSTKKEPVKTVEPAGNKPASATTNNQEIITDTAVLISQSTNDIAPPLPPVSANTVPTKTNTKLWKEYTDSLTKLLKSDIINSKQIKKNTYFVLLDYEIQTDGQVSFTNVTSTPENSFLQAQVKQLVETYPLRLNAVPKKVVRKQQFTVTKD